MLVHGDARQLQIRVGLLRIQPQHPFEIGARLFRIPTHQVMVADVVEERRRGRSLRQHLLVDALGLSALLLRVKPGRLPERVILRRRYASRKGEPG